MTPCSKIFPSDNLSQTQFEYFTASTGVPSINGLEDATVSSEACLPRLLPQLSKYSAFLVACYSPHPLVFAIRKALAASHLSAKPVTGIFEASVATCLATLGNDDKFGIVSTGSQWEGILDDAVNALLGAGSPGSQRYAGTATTGMNANELHDAPKDEVRKHMKSATKTLLEKGARAICLGCAGMAGLDGLVREACVEALGEEEGERVRIVDGVVSGAVHLDGELRV